MTLACAVCQFWYYVLVEPHRRDEVTPFVCGRCRRKR